MRYVVTLYKALDDTEIEKVVDLSSHKSEEKADAQTEAINNALGHRLVDGWFTTSPGDLFAMYE